MTILLVESNDDSRELYAAFLRLQNGVACALAQTADDGLARAAEADVIVTGIRIHGSFDGVELVRRLRAGERTRRKPIIVLTACAGAVDRHRAEHAGCNLFLLKPCLPEELLRELRRLLTPSRIPRVRAARAQPTREFARIPRRRMRSG
jgi:CheY-like chemotaxis protein